MTPEMKMTQEMNEMLDVIKKHDIKFRNNNSSYARYFTPDIPDKIMSKLIKYYDSHLAIQSIVAFYDGSLFSTSKSGVIFTTDGFYTKYIGKPIYIQYASIQKTYVDSDKILHVQVKSGKISDYTLLCVFDNFIFVEILNKLTEIDSKYGQTSFKSSGKVKELDMPENMLSKCRVIIHGASAACGGVGTGLAQIPASDNAVIVPIQITMIVGLGAVFGLHITESTAKSIIASAGASIAGRTISQFLVGWLPVIGNAINTATAAGITEAIGWIAVRNFYKRWLEDKNKGRLDGMKDGYTEASNEYEKKLRKQAEEFLDQIKDVQRERDEYEKLLSDYEEYLKELERKCADADLINDLKGEYDSLKGLRTA